MIADKSIADLVAAALIECSAVTFYPQNHITFASGARSPMYLDNRIVHGHPPQLSLIAKVARDMLRHFGWGTAQSLVSTATGAIPLAAVIAFQLRLPHCWVLKTAKSHGKDDLIQGRIPRGESVLVIEDHLSTGGSTAHTIKQVREVDANVIGCLAVTTYESQAVTDTFADLEVPWLALTSGKIIVTKAKELGLLSDPEHEDIQLWFSDYAAWAANHGYPA